MCDGSLGKTDSLRHKEDRQSKKGLGAMQTTTSMGSKMTYNTHQRVSTASAKTNTEWANQLEEKRGKRCKKIDWID